jgi:Skp family chaperone for outer membrane proteins
MRRRAVALRAALGAAALAAALPVAAAAQGLVGPGFRILDQQRLLSDSRLGQTLLSDLREAEQALERENQALADQLAAEERALTDLRPTLPPEEFRARAEAFDRRVEVIRAERARLSQDLARRFDAEAQQFFQTALPVLTGLMAEQGIVALLSPEAVILGAEWLDITDQAIDRLNRATTP